MQGPRNVPTFVRGSGSYVTNADGRRYLDVSSQLVFTNLGHQHPRIVAAIKEQVDRAFLSVESRLDDDLDSPHRRSAPLGIM